MASATSASFWAVAGGAGTRGLSFLVFLLIARQLAPADMGVMAIALAFGLFMDALNELGMSDQVVRFKGPDSAPFLSSVFWLQLGVSALGGAALVLASPWLAAHYKEPTVVQACVGVAVAAVLTAASQVPVALLRRQMAFRAIAIRNTVATLLGGLFGLMLAYQGHGVLALVAMHVANALTATVVAFVSCTWRPNGVFRADTVQEVRALAMHSLGTRLIETVTSRVDQLLIGSFFGTTVLGLYALAVRFFDVIFQTVCSPIAAVLFSYLAERHEDPVALRDRYLLALRNLALLAPPVFLMAALLLPPALGVLFGPKWVPVAPYLHIMLGTGAVLAVTFSHTAVFSAIGQPRVNLWVSTVSSLVWLASLFFLPALGAVYAAVLWAVRMALGIPIQLVALRRLTRVSVSDYAQAVAPAVLSSVLILVLAWLWPVSGSAEGLDMLWPWVALGLACLLVVGVTAWAFSAALRARCMKLVGRGAG